LLMNVWHCVKCIVHSTVCKKKIALIYGNQGPINGGRLLLKQKSFGLSLKRFLRINLGYA